MSSSPETPKQPQTNEAQPHVDVPADLPAPEVGIDAAPVEESRIVLPAVTRAAVLARNPSLGWSKHVGSKPTVDYAGGPLKQDVNPGSTHHYGTSVSLGRKRSGAPGNTSPNKNDIG